MITETSQNPSYFCAAVITSAHGVRGHVKVKCFMEDPRNFANLSPYCNEEGEAIYHVEKLISQDKDVLILSLEGITDRTEAEKLKGAQMLLPVVKLPELTQDEFYQKDLVGLSVVSSKGEPLGQVHAVHNYGAGDLLEIKTPSEKLMMISFTKEWVPTVDLEEKKIVVGDMAEEYLKEGEAP